MRRSERCRSNALEVSAVRGAGTAESLNVVTGAGGTS